MLVGLQYVGSANGLSVMLYKSYKKALVTWDKPYRFTNKDDVSDKAKAYYLRNYKPLGIRLIEDTTQTIENSDNKVDDLGLENGKVEVVEPPKVEEPKIEESKVEEPKVEEESEEVVITTDGEVDKVESNATADDSSEVEVEDQDVAKNTFDLNSVLVGIREEFGNEAIESLSESDLGSLFDSRLELGQVKEFANLVNYDYGRARNKSKIIDGLVASKLDESIKAILGA